jgi:elongation factor P
MIDISRIKTGIVVKENGQPYVIIERNQKSVGRGGSILTVRMKNLIDGSVLARTYKGNDMAEEADLERKKASYLYKDDEFANFMDSESYEQFTVELDALSDQVGFLKDNTEVDVMYFEGKPVSISLPIKMTFKVVSAPPAVKGNSAQGSIQKQVEIETGATINAPVFIEAGDDIVINTEKGEYVERAK